MHIPEHKRRNILLLLSSTFVVCIFLLQIYRYIDIQALNDQKEENVKLNVPFVERIEEVNNILQSIEKFINLTPARTYEFYQYNHKLSDNVGAYRTLPDTRDAACHASKYENLQTKKVSVIIAFHNEARSTLMRTIISVLQRTSKKYLYELILLDDYSEDTTLLTSLQHLKIPPTKQNILFNNDFNIEFVNAGTTNSHKKNFFVHHTVANTSSIIIKMMRNSQRLGLIESRNRGAKQATGDYLLFLDSHCEVNVGWLEPLLERITASTNSFNAVSPIVDSIDPETLEYYGSSKNLGGFDWSLHFHWLSEVMQSGATAFKSPIFAGGIFMISRKCFFKLKAFNSQLEIWGGESIEFSIKLWLCGGQIEIVPCSRVGHIFRNKHAFIFPNSYLNGNDINTENGLNTYLRNSKIIAELWLDAYKYFFYASKPEARSINVEISRTSVNKLKKELKCRPFVWYLQNVFTTLKIPNDDFIAFGTLSTSELCLQIFNPQRHHRPSASEQLLMSSCYHNDVTHWYLHRYNSYLKSSNGDCLNVVPLSTQYAKAVHSRINYTNGSKFFRVIIESCKTSVKTQRWLRFGTQLIHAHTHLCLDNPLNDIVSVNQCRHLAPTQLFHFSVEMQQQL